MSPNLNCWFSEMLKFTRIGDSAAT